MKQQGYQDYININKFALIDENEQDNKIDTMLNEFELVDSPTEPTKITSL